MQSQDFSVLDGPGPSPKDRTLLSWKSPWGVDQSGRLLFCPAVAKPLEPTFAARPSCKSEKLQVENKSSEMATTGIFIKSSPPPTSTYSRLFFSFSQMQGVFTCSALNECIFRFPLLLLLQPGAVFFHIQHGFGSILEGATAAPSFSARVIIIAANVPRAKRAER